MADPVALVTGASRGIGKQICIDLATAGYDVVCAARSTGQAPGRLPGTIEETAQRVEKQGQRAIAALLDVRDEQAVVELAKRIRQEWGRCDLLVNNAAVAPPKPALQDSIKRWRLAVDVNLNGPFYLIHSLAALLVEAGGHVVNISSGASVLPSFGRPSYTATKRGLEGLTEALAFELSGKVAVNAIQLDVPVWTEGFDATLPEGTDTSMYEDPVIMSDAVLWLAKQPLSFSGKVLTIGELRELGAIRPPTVRRAR